MRDITLEDTFYVLFNTRDFSSGFPATLTGATVSVYPDGSDTQSVSGITLDADKDSVTGLNELTIVATAANSYANGSDYSLVVTAGTINGVPAAGLIVGNFSIGRSAAAVDLANATDGLSALKTLIDAIKVPTDKMVFTKANELDVNTKSINDAEVVGDGNATPWDGA